MEAKFSKGTWSVEECDLPITECTRYDIVGENGGCIAETFYEFDAHLIAAAPDMYALLDELSAFLSFKVKDDTLKGLKLNVDTLLSKARGES